MAHVIELVMGQQPDPSAGSNGWDQHVTIVLHDAAGMDSQDLSDLQDALQETLTEYADGFCCPRDVFDAFGGPSQGEKLDLAQTALEHASKMLQHVPGCGKHSRGRGCLHGENRLATAT